MLWGIEIGKKMDSVLVDTSYCKRISQRHGIELPQQELHEASDECTPVTITHKTDKGIHRIDIPVGKNISPRHRKRFQAMAQKFSKIFYDDPDFFPYLRDPATGDPIYHDLNLKENCVLKNV